IAPPVPAIAANKSGSMMAARIARAVSQQFLFILFASALNRPRLAGIGTGTQPLSVCRHLRFRARRIAPPRSPQGTEGSVLSLEIAGGHCLGNDVPANQYVSALVPARAHPPARAARRHFWPRPRHRRTRRSP